MKKNKLFFITLCFCLGIHPALFAFTIGGIEYSVRSENQASISHAYDTIQGHLVIPQTVQFNGKDYTVTEIGNNAFYGCTALTGITIPESITTIGINAFASCTALTTLFFNAIECNKESRQLDAWWNQLTSVTIGPKVTLLPSGFLSRCTKLTNVTIPESVTTIGEYAFSNCTGLTSITIPENVTTIGDYVFNECTSLTTLFYNAIECNKTTYIYALWNQLTSVTIGPKVTFLPPSLLSRCTGLTSVTIPESVSTIGAFAFSECTGLASVTIPESVTEIGDNAFSECTGLTSITIPESVTTIGDGAFNNCTGLTSITIPENVTKANLNIVNGCAGLTSLVYNAIDCKMDDSYTYQSPWENLTTASFGPKVRVLPPHLLAGCAGLTSVTIPESVTTISNNVFQNCTGLTNITLPQNVTAVGSGAFSYCTGLKRFNWNAIPEAVCSNGALEGSYNLQQLTGPANLLHMFDLNYSSLSKLESIQLTGGVMTDTCFSAIKESYRTLKTIDLSKVNNTSLDDEAFLNFYKLEAIVLPTSLVKIGYKSLAECAALKSITIPQTVEEFDDRAFENCYSLTTINWNNNGALRSIGARAFFNCQSLQALTIPEGVTKLGLAAFQGCGYMETITLPATLNLISDRCFAGNSRVSSLRVNALNPPTISSYTFDDVDRSIQVYVPVDAMGAYQADALWGTFNLIPTGLEQVDKTAFELTVEGRTLIIHGLERPNVSVHDVSGRLIRQCRENRIEVSTSGIYLVRVNGLTQKVVVK